MLSCNCHRKAWCRCRRLPWEGESLIQERCYFFLSSPMCAILCHCVRYFTIVCNLLPQIPDFEHWLRRSYWFRWFGLGWGHWYLRYIDHPPHPPPGWVPWITFGKSTSCFKYQSFGWLPLCAMVQCFIAPLLLQFVCLSRINMKNYVFLWRCCFGVPILCKASPL